MVIEDSCASRTTELGRPSVTDGLVGTGIGYGGGFNGDGIRNGMGTGIIAASYRKGYLITTCVGVLMGRILLRRGAAVTEVPLVAGDTLAGRVGGRGAGKLGGLALANGGEIEIRGGLWVNDDISGGAIGLSAQADSAGIGASHGHGAIGSGGVLLV